MPSYDCECSDVWRTPMVNGVCANCGGWLPGERPPSLTATWTTPVRPPMTEPHSPEDADA